MTDIKNNALDVNLLVPTKFLVSIAKLADQSGDVSFYFDDKNNKIFFAQEDGFVVKMSTADPALIAKFPPVKLLLNKNYKQLAELQRGAFVNRLITTTLVNDSAALFNFKSNQMVVHAISSSGKKPSVVNAPATNLSSDFMAVWGVNHILDFLKILKDDSVCVYIPETDKGSVKFLSKQDPNWSYYVMAQDAKKTKYDQVKVD
jgi:DNA polymerase III sliding clamp (beta) subunit (PCNA family)